MPSDYLVESYIVRIYEYQDSASNRVQGVVETQNGHKQYSFSTARELWSILSEDLRSHSVREGFNMGDLGSIEVKRLRSN